MPIGGKMMDMTDAIVENYRTHHLDALVCLVLQPQLGR
jgi:6-phosphofructokinase 1